MSHWLWVIFIRCKYTDLMSRQLHTYQRCFCSGAFFEKIGLYWLLWKYLESCIHSQYIFFCIDVSGLVNSSLCGAIFRAVDKPLSPVYWSIRRQLHCISVSCIVVFTSQNVVWNEFNWFVLKSPIGTHPCSFGISLVNPSIYNDNKTSVYGTCAWYLWSSVPYPVYLNATGSGYRCQFHESQLRRVFF